MLVNRLPNKVADKLNNEATNDVKINRIITYEEGNEVNDIQEESECMQEENNVATELFDKTTEEEFKKHKTIREEGFDSEVIDIQEASECIQEESNVTECLDNERRKEFECLHDVINSITAETLTGENICDHLQSDGVDDNSVKIVARDSHSSNVKKRKLLFYDTIDNCIKNFPKDIQQIGNDVSIVLNVSENENPHDNQRRFIDLLKEEQVKNKLSIFTVYQSHDKKGSNSKYHTVNNTNVINVYANSVKEFENEFVKKVVAVESRLLNEMLILVLKWSGCLDVLPDCIQALSCIQSNHPKFVIIQTTVVQQEMGDEIEVCSKQEHAIDTMEYCHYGNICVYQTDNEEESNKMIDTIKNKGDVLLCDQLKKYAGVKRVDTRYQDTYFQKIESVDAFIAEIIENELTPSSAIQTKIVNNAHHILIVNKHVEGFYDRDGYNEDIKQFIEASNRSGGTKEIHYDEDRETLLKKLHQMYNNFDSTTVDAIQFSISSHGTKDGFRATDGKVVRINDVLKLFQKVPNDIPIIFFLSYCRVRDNKEPSVDVPGRPPDVDCHRYNVFVFGPLDGTESIRNTSTGSWFLRLVYESFPGSGYYRKNLIDQYPSGISIDDIMFTVNKRLCGYYQIEDGKPFGMITSAVHDTSRIKTVFSVKETAEICQATC